MKFDVAAQGEIEHSIARIFPRCGDFGDDFARDIARDEIVKDITIDAITIGIILAMGVEIARLIGKINRQGLFSLSRDLR